MHPSKLIPLEGQLDCRAGGFDVPELLLAVTETGRSGCLELRGDEAEKRVFLEEGRITFAASSSPDERLGAYLLGRNELRLCDLRALSPRVSPGVRLGALLLERGLIGPLELARAVEGQLRAIVLGIFGLSQASYRFVEEPGSPREPIKLSLPRERWILDGIERVSAWSRVSRGVGALDARYVVVPGHEKSLRELDLDTGSLELLALLRHPRSVEEVCSASELPDLAVCRRLWAFRLLGWVRRLDEDPRWHDPSDALLDADIESLGLILNDAAAGSEQLEE
jgi:hypothetical protein